jgi:hypothetical protein
VAGVAFTAEGDQGSGEIALQCSTLVPGAGLLICRANFDDEDCSVLQYCINGSLKMIQLDSLLMRRLTAIPVCDMAVATIAS